MSACASGDARDANLKIEALSATPAMVADGESFEINWKVSHPTKTGYVTEIGLFLGHEADLSSSSGPDSRRLFNLAITAGVANGADESSMTCKRTGTILQCTGLGGPNGGRDINLGPDMTFRACSSYVLSTDATCEMRPVIIAFDG